MHASRSSLPVLALLAGLGSLTQLVFALPSAEQTNSARDAARLQAVVSFADHVLRDAADHYRSPASPLLANGVNPDTKEALRWRFPDGREAVISDFAEEQNLLRVLCSLSALTGDPRYRESARAQVAYYFDHYQEKSGLLRMGGHRCIDLLTLESVGPEGSPDSPHELKNAFPYYELMYEVNPEATVRYIRAFWNAHVYNWRTLEISRHGEFSKPFADHTDSAFDDPAPYFETKGLSFLDAGNDLIYSGAMLYRLSGDKMALLWSKRLAHQYVKARDPHTGLGAYQFTQPRKTDDTTDDNQTFSNFGDRAKRQLGPEFPGHLVLEATVLFRSTAMTIYCNNALMQLQLGQLLGSEGQDFVDWTHSGLLAFQQHAMIPGQNLLRPMLTDGTDLSGFVVKRNGYYFKAGTRLDPYAPTPELMLSYARAFLVTRDASLWAMARGIARERGLGDLGSTPGHELQLNLKTSCADVYVLFSLIDIYRETKDAAYLELARVVGDNLVRQRFNRGYFTASDQVLFANVNALEPYALLALEAAIRGKPELVPAFINGFGFFDATYHLRSGRDQRMQDQVLFHLTKAHPEVGEERPAGGRSAE